MFRRMPSAHVMALIPSWKSILSFYVGPPGHQLNPNPKPLEFVEETFKLGRGDLGAL